jgi:uncharacterized phage protein gp47/JayE
MPFAVPTLEDLVKRAARAFRANLKGSDAMLWPNNVATSSKVIGGAVWEPFSFLEYISRQIFAATADQRFLERHAYDFGLSRLPATFASGTVQLNGDADITVPAGLELERGDGLVYVITRGGRTSDEGLLDVAVRCQTAGRTGNALPGVAMTLREPFARIEPDGEVAASGIGGGADVESDASLRARVLFRKRMPPHGGAAHDYVAWAREINGVTRVFVDPVTSTNARTTIGVWVLMDGTYTNGIPLEADVDRVAAYIDTVRPAGALVDVMAPSATPVAITITGLSPDTSAVRDAVRAELADLFQRARVSTLTDPFQMFRSKIVEAISAATGEDHHTVTVPAGDTTAAAGQLLTLGAVTFA